MQALIFDFNGTLSGDVFWSGLDVELVDAIQRRLFVEDEEMINRWMLGEMTSEQVCRLLSKELGIPFNELYFGLKHSCRKMSIKPEIMQGIQFLRRSNPVFLVTNNMDCFSRFFVPKKQLNKKFDGIYNSADYGVFKEQKDGLFDIVLEENNLTYSSCILFDDSQSVIDYFLGKGGSAKRAENCVTYDQHIRHAFQLSLF